MIGAYPYRAWVVLPAGGLKEVELVKEAWGSSSAYGRWDEAESGKTYRIDDLHPSKDAAIAAGLASLDQQQAKLNRQQSSIDKKRAKLIAIAKATGEQVNSHGAGVSDG